MTQVYEDEPVEFGNPPSEHNLWLSNYVLRSPDRIAQQGMIPALFRPFIRGEIMHSPWMRVLAAQELVDCGPRVINTLAMKPFKHLQYLIDQGLVHGPGRAVH